MKISPLSFTLIPNSCYQTGIYICVSNLDGACDKTCESHRQCYGWCMWFSWMVHVMKHVCYLDGVVQAPLHFLLNHAYKYPPLQSIGHTQLPLLLSLLSDFIYNFLSLFFFFLLHPYNEGVSWLGTVCGWVAQQHHI